MSWFIIYSSNGLTPIWLFFRRHAILGQQTFCRYIYSCWLVWLSCINGRLRFLGHAMPLHLTHWGRVTHICVSNLTIIVSDNGLSPGRCQAIIWTNAGILLIGPLGTNFSGILIGIQTFSFKKIHLKMSSAKWSLFSLGLNVLKR